MALLEPVLCRESLSPDLNAGWLTTQWVRVTGRRFVRIARGSSTGPSIRARRNPIRWVVRPATWAGGESVVLRASAHHEDAADSALVAAEATPSTTSIPRGRPLGYYRSLCEKSGDVFLPAHPDGASDDWPDFAVDHHGATWLFPAKIDGRWTFDIERLGEGPAGS